MTQDRYLGLKLTDRQTAEVLDKLLGVGLGMSPKVTQKYPLYCLRALVDDLGGVSTPRGCAGEFFGDCPLFDLRRAPSGSSLTIGGCAGCSATVRGAGSSPGS
jgi:hypothetical protein